MTSPLRPVDYQGFSDDTTDFIANLKRVFADINIRVAAVENINSKLDEFEQRYGEVALNRIDAAIAPVLQDIRNGLAETRAELEALDAYYRTNVQEHVDSILEPLLADAQIALAQAQAQLETISNFLALKQSVSEKGQPNGYASLDAGGKVPSAQLSNVVTAGSVGAALANTSTDTPADSDSILGLKAGGSIVFRLTFAGLKSLLGAIFVGSNGSTWTPHASDVRDATKYERWLSAAAWIRQSFTSNTLWNFYTSQAQFYFDKPLLVKGTIKAGSTFADTVLTDAGGTVKGGYTGTGKSDGSKTGVYTPSPADGNFRSITNGGALQINAPTVAGDYGISLGIANGASAGAVTLSGFTKTSGDSFTTTNGARFIVYINKMTIEGTAITHAHTVALQ